MTDSHAQTTLHLLQQADAQGIDVDDERMQAARERAAGEVDGQGGERSDE